MRRFLIPLVCLFCVNAFSQIYIDHVDNDCPQADLLKVCLGDEVNYEGQFAYKTYDHLCGDDTITGTVRVFRNQLGEYFVDDFSFGTWKRCFDLDYGPSGTLRLFIECGEVVDLNGTDNYGDVWGTSLIRYTGTSVILSWFNTYPEFGTTELTPIDGRPINEPEDLFNSEYNFQWSTGEVTQTIQVTDPGTYSVTVEGPNGFNESTTLDVLEDDTVFDESCSDRILEVLYFLDRNQNGIRDSEDKVLTPGDQYIEFDPSVKYKSIELNTSELYVLGNTLYRIQDVHPAMDISNDPSELIFRPEIGVSRLDIGLYEAEESATATLDITSTAIERCNAVVPFRIKIRNTGTTPFEERVRISYPPELTYINADLDPAAVSDEIVEWDIVLEEHGDELEIILLLQMPSVDFLGEIFCLTPDYGNNTRSIDAFCFELVCAYDPNDKHGTPFRGDRNFTLFEEELKYTIRFENLGNDTAFNVRIEDQLSDMFDLDSYKFIQSSHTVTRQYIRSDRTLIFDFKNIQLPSIEQDSVANKGFVQFSIRPLGTLPEESELLNDAGIFFDLNDPIITNETQHTLVSELETSSTLDLNRGSVQLLINPNPVLDRLQYAILDKSLPQVKSSRVVDLTGRHVHVSSYRDDSIDVSNLQDGIYILIVELADGRIATERFVKS